MFSANRVRRVDAAIVVMARQDVGGVGVTTISIGE